MKPGGAELIHLKPRRGAFWHHLREYFRYPFAYTVSSIIGIIMSIIPAAGPSIGALISYGEVRRHSPEPGTVRHRALGRARPTDTGKNAVVGGSIIPLLTLGVPGSPAAAILLGGPIIHGLFPGPELFTTHARITYTFMVAMVFASFAILVVGVAGSRIWGQVTKFPIQYLTPTVIALCVIGSQPETTPWMCWPWLAWAWACFWPLRWGLSRPRWLSAWSWGIWPRTAFCWGGCSPRLKGLSGPISSCDESHADDCINPCLAGIHGRHPGTGEGAVRGGNGEKETGHDGPADGGGETRKYHVNMAVGVLALLFAFWAERHLAGLERESVVFPIVILWIVRAVGLVMIAQEIIWGRRHNRGSRSAGSRPR